MFGCKIIVFLPRTNRPSGQAEAIYASASQARRAAEVMHKRDLGSRYIECFFDEDWTVAPLHLTFYLHTNHQQLWSSSLHKVLINRNSTWTINLWNASIIFITELADDDYGICISFHNQSVRNNMVWIYTQLIYLVGMSNLENYADNFLCYFTSLFPN